MTIEEFNQTRFGAGMQVKINKTGDIKCIVSVDFEECLIGVSKNGDNKDDLNWIKIEELDLIHDKCTFSVKISDRYCEWEYGFDYNKLKPACIDDFAKGIERYFGIERKYSKLIKRFEK